MSLLVLLLACKQDYSVTEVPDRIAVLPELSDLGAKQVGGTYTFQLQIDSVEGEDIPVVNASVTNIAGSFFAFTGELGAVPADAPLLLDFTYTPTEAGFHRAAITIVSESREPEITVQVRAHAAAPSASIYPPLLDFGAVDPGDDADLEVTLTNDGEVAIELASAAFTDDHFTLGGGAPATLGPGSSIPLSVTFAATDADAVHGTMSLDLGPFASVGRVTLAANDCLAGPVDVYDADHDGFTSCGGDCDDGDALAHPGGEETCNAADDDCDRVVDEGTSCVDDDGDGTTEDDGDCNDGDEDVSPLEAEIADNGVDDDCDGVVDGGSPDDDGDGYTALGGDCDETDATVHPGAAEEGDGDDDDCDGTIDEGTDAYDDDGDRYTEAAGDCDDTDATVHPSATEAADWVDDDCDGTVDEGTVNADDDGDGFTETGGDCDDTSASVSPGVPETSGNGVDDDCDGVKS